MSLTVVYAYIAREKLIDTSSHRRPMDIFSLRIDYFKQYIDKERKRRRS